MRLRIQISSVLLHFKTFSKCCKLWAMNKLQIGQEIVTEVVAISGDTVFLDLNSKSEGVLESAELLDADGNLTVKEGDKIKAFFVGEKNGEMRFTTKIAGEKADKDMLENAFQNHIPVEGFVEKEIKGGYEIRIGNSRAFCPFSQMGGRRKEENETFVGKHLTFAIQEYKENGKNILVSNRAITEMQRQAFIENLQKTIEVGSVVKGTVKSLQSYGAFVEVQGFQALLPISEISLSRVEDISKELEVGQEITAKVISTDWQRERVSLSLKSLIKDPWDDIAERFEIEQKVKGTISKIMDFGVFVELEKGVDGLVHISTIEKAGEKTNLRKLFKIGEAYDVQILAIDAENKRISLRPATSAEQDENSAEYLSSQKDDGETYNPFVALLKKK